MNFLQVASLAQAFPLRWPQIVENLFAFQSAVSTIGEALINPDCITSMSAAELFYNKQIGFSILPIVSVCLSFYPARIVISISVSGNATVVVVVFALAFV